MRRLITALLSWGTVSVFILMHLSVCLVWLFPCSWVEITLLVSLFFLRMWAITAGYHRYFAHKAYKTSRIFQFFMAVLGCGALQKGPMWWAAEHRQHHSHSDQPGDPHSPIVRSVWWSHIGWVLDRTERRTRWELMPDWQRYPELRWLDTLHMVPAILLAGLCYLISGWSGVMWGFVLGTVCLYHCTFLVNSLAHLAGYRRYATSDRSRNNWLVALLTLGEGWHNNHHHYQSAARQGLTWYELDVTYLILRVLAWVGIVWDIREPTPAALDRDRLLQPVRLFPPPRVTSS